MKKVTGKKATKFSEKDLQVIAAIQQQSGVTRKTAVKKFQAQQKAAAKAGAAATAVAPAPAKEAPKKAARVKAEPKPKLTPEQVSANRKEGIRLFSLAGKPSKQQFVAVYGERGHKMTWDERAKAANLASAEQAAKTFQATLAKVAPKLVTPAAPANVEKVSTKTASPVAK